jgi:phage anti-repressor protein
MLKIYRMPPCKGKESSGERIMLSSHDLYDNIDKCPVQYARWLKHNVVEVGIRDIDYIKNEDYEDLRKGPISKDLLLTLDFAKGLCQVARTPAGKKLRAWLLTL